jgi:hypothetical protein
MALCAVVRVLPSDNPSGWAQLPYEFECAQDVDHADDVIGHGGETEFRLRRGGAAQQQTWMPEDAVFKSGEGMLDGCTSKLHRIGCGTLMHSEHGAFIQQPRDSSCPGFCAVRLFRKAPQSAGSAV